MAPPASQQTAVYAIVRRDEGAWLSEVRGRFSSVELVRSSATFDDLCGTDGALLSERRQPKEWRAALARASALDRASPAGSGATSGGSAGPTEAEICRTLSHVRALLAAWSGGHSAALVLEEGQAPRPLAEGWRAAGGVDGLVASLPPFWQIVQLSMSPGKLRNPAKLSPLARNLISTWLPLRPLVMARSGPSSCSRGSCASRAWIHPRGAGSYLISRQAMHELLHQRMNLVPSEALKGTGSALPRRELQHTARAVNLALLVQLSPWEGHTGSGAFDLSRVYVATPPLFIGGVPADSTRRSSAWAALEAWGALASAGIASGSCPSPFALLVKMQHEYDRVMAPLLYGVHRVAILDFPLHTNVGDLAIFAGQTRYLSHRGIEVAYVCGSSATSAVPTCSLASLLAALPVSETSAVLFQGGGNVGDVWVGHDRFRARTVRQLHALGYKKVVLLPQSIFFRDPSPKAPAMVRTRTYMAPRRVGPRRNLPKAGGASTLDFGDSALPFWPTVLLRDNTSLHFARTHLCSQPSAAMCAKQFRLIPDSAIWLAPFTRSRRPYLTLDAAGAVSGTEGARGAKGAVRPAGRDVGEETNVQVSVSGDSRGIRSTPSGYYNATCNDCIRRGVGWAGMDVSWLGRNDAETLAPSSYISTALAIGRPPRARGGHLQDSNRLTWRQRARIAKTREARGVRSMQPESEDIANVIYEVGSGTDPRSNLSIYQWDWNVQRIDPPLNQSDPVSWEATALHFFSGSMYALERGVGVVSDRLHGHLFALIHQLPHVVMDNANGKVYSYMQTWEAPCVDAAYIAMAKNPVEAFLKLRKIIERIRAEEASLAF